MLSLAPATRRIGTGEIIDNFLCAGALMNMLTMERARWNIFLRRCQLHPSLPLASACSAEDSKRNDGGHRIRVRWTMLVDSPRSPDRRGSDWMGWASSTPDVHMFFWKMHVPLGLTSHPPAVKQLPRPSAPLGAATSTVARLATTFLPTYSRTSLLAGTHNHHNAQTTPMTGGTLLV